MSDYFTDDILENKFGITDVAMLHKIEERIVADQTSALLSRGCSGVPDLGFFKSVHACLFEQIYDFAGKFRTVDIAKHDSMVPFCYARFIDSESARIFTQLEGRHYLVGMERQGFIEQMAGLAGELNALHPFREGNGRTIRLYLILLADRAGYLIDYSRVSARGIIRADKEAFEGDISRLVELYDKVVLAG